MMYCIMTRCDGSLVIAEPASLQLSVCHHLFPAFKPFSWQLAMSSHIMMGRRGGGVPPANTWSNVGEAITL